MTTIIIFLSLAIFFVLLLLIEEYCSVAPPDTWKCHLFFEDKWPAISDDEFVKRCKPGTRREVALKVRRIVSEQLGIPYDHIYPEQHFVNDLGCG